MIIKESLLINNKEFIRTYSDSGFMIERDNVRYSEAIDLASLNREYTESNEYVDGYTEEATEEDYLNALTKLGVE